jgi:hypothetical protein
MSRNVNGSFNVQSMFDRLDGSDDAISESEFVDFIAKIQAKIPPKRVKFVFRR